MSTGGVTVNEASWDVQLATAAGTSVVLPLGDVFLPLRASAGVAYRPTAAHPVSVDCEVRRSSSAFCLSLSEQGGGEEEGEGRQF